ncbi:predicted protein [Naegleria gruberi]|uniref:Predicted protein n=1 Tax=Naegleria gruberi TaxID=5762 RepID=D2W1B2_NAEGR|nr:uncharacterized protein NAEGRDRAFT_53927 [Naegleria gruberi]EFC37155.1 predicted protein [Naegleria gruberi]|eukprot:XP_002669899.1 predicted protein [Naegleria gruberi strain NEG-M]
MDSTTPLSSSPTPKTTTKQENGGKTIQKTASKINCLSPLSPTSPAATANGSSSFMNEGVDGDSVSSTGSGGSSSKRKKHKFQARDYCLVFEEAIKDVECMDIFKSFLKNCSSEEMLEFIQEYDRYEKVYKLKKLSYFVSPLRRRSITSGGSATSGESYHSNVTTTASCVSNVSDLSVDWNQLKQGVVELKESALSIIDTFVSKGSKKEINIGSLQKQSLERFEEINKQILTVDLKSTTSSSQGLETLLNVLDLLNPSILFDGMALAISTDLKFDQFPRFVRSDALFKFLQKKGEKYTRSIAINISQGYEIDIRFKPSDLEDRIIDDKLIYFGFTVMQDTPDWEFVKVTDLYQLQLSKTTYFFDNDKKESGLKLHKTVAIFPFPLQDVWNMVCNPENHFKFDPKGNEDFKVRDYFPPNDPIMKNPYALTEIETEPKFGPFMKRRHLPFILSTFYDHGLQGYIVICRSFNDEPNYPDRIHYEGFNYSIYLPIDDYHCRAIFIDYTDIKLPFSNGTLFEKATYKIYSGAKIKGMLKVMKDLSQDGKKRIEMVGNDERNWNKSVELHKELYPERSWYNEWQRLKKF